MRRRIAEDWLYFDDLSEDAIASMNEVSNEALRKSSVLFHFGKCVDELKLGYRVLERCGETKENFKKLYPIMADIVEMLMQGYRKGCALPLPDLTLYRLRLSIKDALEQLRIPEVL